MPPGFLSGANRRVTRHDLPPGFGSQKGISEIKYRRRVAIHLGRLAFSWGGPSRGTARTRSSCNKKLTFHGYITKQLCRSCAVHADYPGLLFAGIALALGWQAERSSRAVRLSPVLSWAPGCYVSSCFGPFVWLRTADCVIQSSSPNLVVAFLPSKICF